MILVEYNDKLVRDAIKMIQRRPGLILKRIASELNVDYDLLSRQFIKRGVKISDVRKTHKKGHYQKFEGHNRKLN